MNTDSGWYHCECRDGYHDNEVFSANGESCANDTVCFNLDGGFDCRCPHGHNCSGDCIHNSRVRHNAQIWVLDTDHCSVCSSQCLHQNGLLTYSSGDTWIDSCQRCQCLKSPVY